MSIILISHNNIIMNLKNYFEILEGKKKPKFKSANLDEKIKEAFKILKKCELCERKCGVNRTKETGFCRVRTEWRIFGAHVHLGEEHELIPSGTIFLAGCPMRCVYCQNAPHSVEPELGEVWSDKKVAEWIDVISKICKNINFVTPDCYLWNILKVLKKVESNIPVVWNSSAYYSEKTAELIKDIVDVYLLDFRYFSEECAKKLSYAPNYPEVAKRNFLIAKDGEMIIRILVMPGHIDCDAKPILKWIKNNLGTNVRVNILGQYKPYHKAERYKEINRALSMWEYEEVIEYAKKLGLWNL